MNNINKQLFDFISASPTAFHAVRTVADTLDNAGYTALSEADPWALTPGKGYYVTRNGSSLIAFRVPAGVFSCFMLAAAHSDAPCFKIKENAMLGDGTYIRVSAEKYGGMLCAPWMDRPLGVAGRVVLRTADGITTRLVDLGHDDEGNPVTNAIIPSVAIHMNRAANDGASYNAAVDMVPLAGMASSAADVRASAADRLGVSPDDVLTCDLYVYNPQSGTEWNGLIASPRLDDQQCAFACTKGFVDAADAGETGACPVLCIFDNEEVGSQTRQGAASTFLWDVLCRMSTCLGLSRETLLCRVASGLMLSCDNGHAIHPNHPEFADKNHTVKPNGGVVIKYNASQKYTSDGLSAALFGLICQQAGVPTQKYTNRADIAGGSTLGNISGTQVSVPTVDIGLAQLAMHSSYETGGADDTAHMVNALTAFYRHALIMSGDGTYTLK